MMHNLKNRESTDAPFTSGCVEGDIRLAEGNLSTEGRVELCKHGMWGTVCDNGWEKYEAKVVCRQLGFSTVNSSMYVFFNITANLIVAILCSPNI